MVRQLAVFLSRIGGRIGLPFGRSRVEEDLGAHWVALNIYVMLGDVDPAASIPVGDSNGRGFAGFMTVEAVLKMVQDGWGCWDRSTQARWCRTLAEVTPYLLREGARPRPRGAVAETWSRLRRDRSTGAGDNSGAARTI